MHSWINLGLSREKLRAARNRFSLKQELMILFDVVHPPAVSTSLSFAFRTGEVDNYTLFGMAVAMTAVLVIIEQAALRIMFRFKR